MAAIGVIKELLEAGVHFGHPKKKWNPKMKPYIYGLKRGIYIIDLERTAQLLLKACEFVRDISSSGGSILFVGTKRQVQDMVEEEAKRCGMFYVNNRWLGGALTNFETVRKSVSRLKDIQHLKEEGKYALVTKKEQAGLDKELNKLLRNLGGIVDMDRLPDAIYVIDPNREEIAVREAIKLNIPVVSIIDTNCDPTVVDYLIPGNDDAIKSCKLITSYIANAVIEGRRFYVDSESKAKEEKETTIKAKEAVESGVVGELGKKIEDKSSKEIKSSEVSGKEDKE
ncbi:MAG: 30S ribosomal protein S2 [Candidatus Kaelpia imicola]|nr:30S ribosomal protein S2 [Candidatus Kaelpia imicola]